LVESGPHEIPLIKYLEEREQRVKVGGTYSEWSQLLKGGPQGSILGRVLFNVFINDIFISAILSFSKVLGTTSISLSQLDTVLSSA
jgi:hypothetical protein